MALKLSVVSGANGDKYYAIGRLNGVRVNRSTGYGLAQKRLAMAELKRIEKEILTGAPSTSKRSPKRSSSNTLMVGLSTYLNRPGGVGVTTANYVRSFAEAHKDKSVEEIMPIDVINFVTKKIKGKKPKSDSTLRREINAIQGFLNFLREGLMLSALTIRKPAEHEPQTTRFTEEQRNHMLAVCEEEEPWFVPHLTFLFYTGARRSEVCRLRWCDIEWCEANKEPKVVIMRSRKGARGRVIERRVPVHPVLGPIIKAMRMLRRPRPEHHVFLSCTGQPINTPAGINKAFARVASVARLSHLTPHDARRTFGSDLLGREVSDVVITDMLGHVDKKMLKVYAVVDDGIRASAVQKISSPIGG